MDALASLDLNLLRTLDVLLQTRSVTDAARRLGRSQPAVSHALGRLRVTLGDPLLVREGGVLVPTARALALEQPLRRALQDLREVLARTGSFDPATSTRRFVLACPDALAPVLPDILGALADAPHLQIDIRADRGPRALDAADVLLDVLPDDAPGVQARVLGSTRAVVAMRAGHPALERPWDVQTWLAWPHVQVRFGTDTPSPLGQMLAARGLERRVGLYVPNLLLAPHVVARTDAFFTGALQLLAPFVDTLGLVLREPPLPVPPVRAAALWKVRHADDPGHRWFRERLVEALTARFDAIVAAYEAEPRG
ncbi:MAG: LysR family transcriptional regulator [Alphaproteobacteria bacterium]|nr:LysR family transcriptional regulator [Alphaproteobacteria bacterium]